MRTIEILVRLTAQVPDSTANRIQPFLDDAYVDLPLADVQLHGFLGKPLEAKFIEYETMDTQILD